MSENLKDKIVDIATNSRRNEFIFNELSKNSKVNKDKLIEILEQNNIELETKRISREELLLRILENDLMNNVFEVYKDDIYIPVWTVGDYFGMYSNQIDKLHDIRAIKEAPVEQEFYNSRKTKWKAKGYYEANTYPLSVLSYNLEDLNNALNEAYGVGFKTRIEVKTKEEAQKILDELSKVFEVTTGLDTYEKRDIGYHCYVGLRLLNNSEYEKNRFLNEIDNLNLKLKDQKQEHIENIKNMQDEILYFLEIDNDNTRGFKDLLLDFIVDFNKTKRENNKLKELLKENNIEF